jgi:branched-chain amino acid transport system substrate-binding protein
LQAGTPVMATLVGGDKEFPALTAKLSSADAILFAGYPVEAGMLYTQLRKAGSNPAFLKSDGCATAELKDTFGDGLRGTLVMRPRFALAEEDGSRDVEARILAGDEALAHAAVAAFASAANAADSVNSVVAARELAARAYQTVRGQVRFDRKGDAVRPSFDVDIRAGNTWKSGNSGPKHP